MGLRDGSFAVGRLQTRYIETLALPNGYAPPCGLLPRAAIFLALIDGPATQGRALRATA